MLTFNQTYSEVQEQVEDDSSTSLVLIKRAINQGMQKFGAILNREWRVQERTFSTVANQQYYQLPEDCVRPKSIVITIGGVSYPLREVANDAEWHDLNAHQASETSDIPELYYVKGSDQFGIWPIPSSGTSNAGRIAFEPRMRRMSQDDYTTGTVAVTASSVAVVGTGTTFTAQMVGRTLLVEDGSDQDGVGYKIESFTDATHISLENYYGGLTGSGKSYRIGEVPDIPDEFHESLVDYACCRYYKRRRDRGMAGEMKAAFDEAIIICRDTYSSTSSSQYLRAPRVHTGRYIHHRRDYRVT